MPGIEFEPSELKRLVGQRVDALMSGEVITVPGSATMGEAAHLLLSHRVSGGPVVDDQGRCIGVLSMTDFAKREDLLWQHDDQAHEREHCVVEDGGHYCINELPKDRVVKYMTSAVQTIAASATVFEAARCMAVERIHRLFALDSAARPVGVLTSLDLVTALTNAAAPFRPE